MTEPSAEAFFPTMKFVQAMAPAWKAMARAKMVVFLIVFCYYSVMCLQMEIISKNLGYMI